MAFLASFLIITLLSACASFSNGQLHPKMGVCYGKLGRNLPTPKETIRRIQNLKAKRVKLYDTGHEILAGVQGIDIEVSIMIPSGELITTIALNQTFSDEWVQSNILQYYPRSKIRYLLVGNRLLSYASLSNIWNKLVPAMKNLRRSLNKSRLTKIKVGTPLAMDMLETTFPPSNATFIIDDERIKIIRELLGFLNRSKSFYFVDVFTYYDWRSNFLNLNYALLQPSTVNYTDMGSGLTYTNLLDQKLDAVVFAMKKLGYPNIRLFVSQTGWPSDGNSNDPGANIYNAATYNRNVVRKFMANPPVGIPSRPGAMIPAFILSLYNEDLKKDAGTDSHFGLLYPNGSHVYPIDLTGNTRVSEYPEMPKPESNGKLWCVATESGNMTQIAEAMSFVCRQDNRTCDPIRAGGACYSPDTLINHASYAFSAYRSMIDAIGTDCFFNESIAQATLDDPSYGSCKFPSINL